MKNRRERAEAYTDGGGLECPSWGRLKKLAEWLPEIIDDAEAGGINLEDGELDLMKLVKLCPPLGDVLLALYMMPFEQLRALNVTTYRGGCAEFSDDVALSDIVRCATAAKRDWESVEASMVELIDMGKMTGKAEGQTLSRMPSSSQLASV